MVILHTKEQVQAQCEHLGVRFYRHGEAGSGTNIGAWGRLLHGPEFTKTTLVTLCPRILLPTTCKDPMDLWRTINHELIHWAQQFDYGLWMWAARYGFSKDFRYKMERPAFLVDVLTGRLRLDEVVRRLRAPKGLYRIKHVSEAEMFEWFTARGREVQNGVD